MVNPRSYAEKIAATKAEIARVATSEETRRAIPVSSHSPKISSKGGNQCANGLTAHCGSIWYESTPIANIEREVLMEASDQGSPPWGLIFAYAA